MAEVLKKFGRYFLLDHLAQGGMAEIYRARMASPDGAGRLIVIKKIQAGYGGNAEFLQMFKSEIKVTMGFSHPNIVQLFDFGEENNQPYIAMEWLDGKNLRQFMSRYNDLKQTFPVELATYIAEQSAAGLQYAHSYKDKITGAPLDIVHRDISPQNILISFEGSVKVIDFGIAKATTNSESTRAGVIKGKPSYLSPEQISGDQLDGRSDIFALGTVLWELLTGRKLFAGDNALAVLKLIESAQTHVKPPSTVNPKVPKELDAIVLKTLQKQREKRYANAEELQRALRKFLYAYSPDFNPSDLAQVSKELFKNEIVEDRKKIQRLSEKVEEILSIQQTSQIVVDNAPSVQIDLNRSKDGTPTLVDPRLRSSGGREAFTIHPEAGNFEMDKVPVTQGRTSTRTPYSNGSSNRQTSTAIRPSTTQTRYTSNSSEKPSSPKSMSIAIGLVGALAIGASFLGIRVPVVTDILNRVIGKQEQTNLSSGERLTASSPNLDLVSNPATPNSTILLKLNVFPNDAKDIHCYERKNVEKRYF